MPPSLKASRNTRETLSSHSRCVNLETQHSMDFQGDFFQQNLTSQESASVLGLSAVYFSKELLQAFKVAVHL